MLELGIVPGTGVQVRTCWGQADIRLLLDEAIRAR